MWGAIPPSGKLPGGVWGLEALQCDPPGTFSGPKRYPKGLFGAYNTSNFPHDGQKVLDLDEEDLFSAPQGPICTPLHAYRALHGREFALPGRDHTAFDGEIVLKHRPKPVKQGRRTPLLPMWGMLYGVGGRLARHPVRHMNQIVHGALYIRGS